MPANKRERPIVKGKDAERFLNKVRDNNKKMQGRKGEWERMTEICQDYMKKTGTTIEDVRGWLKEYREQRNKEEN